MTLRQVLKFLALPLPVDYGAIVEIFNQIITTLIMVSLFTGMGIIFERWLVEAEIVPDRTRWVIINAIGCVLIKQIFFRQISWWLIGPAIILAMTFGVHRGDIWKTMQDGRGWWKSEQ